MKKLTAFLFSFLFFLSFANSAFAISLCPTNSQYSRLCTLNIGTAIGNLVIFIYIIAVIAALLYLLWGGLKWLTSGGDKTSVQAAREHITAAIIGLVIIFLSYLILSLIAKFFLGTSFDLKNIILPTIFGTSTSGGGGGTSGGSTPI